MYKLYFMGPGDKKQFVRQSADLNQIHAYMDADIKYRDLKRAPFDRSWLSNGGKWIDFGSYTCFYFIEGVTLKDICK